MTDPAPDGQSDLFDRWLAHRTPVVPAEATPPPPVGRRRRDVPPDTPSFLPDAPDAPPVAQTPPPPPAPLPEPEPEQPPPPAPDPVAAAPTRRADQPDLPAAVDEDLARPTFRPRRTARLVTGLLLLVSLAGTGLLARETYENRADLATADLVLVGIGAVLTLVLWAVRTSTSVAHLAVEGGQLTIARNGETWRCDLASRATPIEVVGTPGRRGWKVLFARRGRPPYVVDSSVVDPAHFTRVLAHYRPDVVSRP